ncbi:LuxR C-terminal-related transcriptional regulator [Saccharothrix sp. S26]|uniref:helix-turn-helix transcriptional regulator n=1 Tax=Saccharothrix sp. S26 TaxID=2907215 RepID=UPI001F329C94|nr:LuxR C-terminal-related transcriptional regulator [Saccharothrix sp. S26]MCE6995147.1 LuxR C-terminal-related transcriptional regulator [Saccharothrix sp. S26]
MITSELGLGTTADFVYRTMLRRVRWRFSDLVRELGWDEIGTREVMGDLRTLGFLVESADDASAVRAVEPRLALPVLAARRLKDGPRGGVPGAAAVDRFVAAHERASDVVPGRREGVGFDDLAVLVERFAASANREVLVVVPTYSPGSYEFSPLIAEAVHRRGAQFRCVWSDEFTMSPAVVPHARWLAERGMSARTTAGSCVRAVIVDGSTALVVNREMRMEVLRGSRAVEPLHRTATALWTQGRPAHDAVAGTPVDAPRRRYEIVLRLLAEGLTDDAVANRIGVSVRTVRNDVASAMAGMDARSRFQAGVRAAQLGLL